MENSDYGVGLKVRDEQSNRLWERFALELGTQEQTGLSRSKR